MCEENKQTSNCHYDRIACIRLTFQLREQGSVVVGRNTETGESSFRGKNILKDDGEQPVQAMLYGQ